MANMAKFSVISRQINQDGSIIGVMMIPVMQLTASHRGSQLLHDFYTKSSSNIFFFLLKFPVTDFDRSLVLFLKDPLLLHIHFSIAANQYLWSINGKCNCRT